MKPVKSKIQHIPSLQIEESVLALQERVTFVQRIVDEFRPTNILDIGCGTGEELTKFIAILNPDISITAIDNDQTSITYAKNRHQDLKNISFQTSLQGNQKFDLIILSEVLEHAIDPDDLLTFTHSKLNDQGVLFLSVPNGYGPSEFMAILFQYLELSGLFKIYRSLKRRVKQEVPKNSNAVYEIDSFSQAPHVNFFSMKKIQKLISDHGYLCIGYQGRMFLHNFIFSILINKSKSMAKINRILGKALPSLLVSDWMFILKKENKQKNIHLKYERNSYEKWRIKLYKSTQRNY